MLDHTMRSYKDRLLRPVAVSLGGVHPSAITLLALLIGLAAALLAARQMYGWGLALWLVNRFFDGLDGMVARAYQRQSDLGGYLDTVADFVVYAAIPIGLFLGQPTIGLATSLIFLLATFYVNGASWMYLSAILEKRSAGATSRGDLTTVTMPASLIGGTETIVFYCVFFLWPGRVGTLFAIMAALVALGILQRLWWARYHLPASAG